MLEILKQGSLYLDSHLVMMTSVGILCGLVLCCITIRHAYNTRDSRLDLIVTCIVWIPYSFIMGWALALFCFFVVYVLINGFA